MHFLRMMDAYLNWKNFAEHANVNKVLLGPYLQGRKPGPSTAWPTTALSIGLMKMWIKSTWTVDKPRT